MKSPILDRIPWGDVLSTLDAMADAGWERDEALDSVAALLDKMIPLDALVPAPAGGALEAIDGPVIRAALGLAWQMAADPDARAKRKARREARRAQRQG